MQADRWERLEQVFAEALAQPVAARSAFLERRCADDAELRLEIEALLHAHDAPGVLDADPGQTARGSQPASLAPGARLGAWQIDGLIGRGGMGEVYLATRADQGFTQRGALKLLRHEAAGQLERFHAERQILARLEHPGIARLLDGGTTVDGRPYTVMEYVEGRSLTDYCEETRASFGERLNLFLQVCEAVAFAHRNLVIHRDLKPDNILVDASGKVKLLDFGIAKLIDISAVIVADHTVAPYTPDYAAPEQLSGEAVTTGTDIYALGVVLFELMTGERPLRTRGLPSTQALRLALDRDAPTASRTARQNAQTPIPARQLRGDLDAIIAKCLRKEASHRYETVNGLKLDLGRHVRNEPVLARSGARAYVAGRFLRRHWLPLSAVAVLIVSMGAAALYADNARRHTEQALKRADAVRDFVIDLFRQNDPDAGNGRSMSARDLVDIGARSIEHGFDDDTDTRIELLGVSGKLYYSLGDYPRSAELLKRRLDQATLAYPTDDPRRIRAQLDMAVTEIEAQHFDPAHALLEQALTSVKAAGDEQLDLHTDVLSKLGWLEAERDHNSLAIKWLDQAIALRKRDPGLNPAKLAELLATRGLYIFQDGHIADAEQPLREALALLDPKSHDDVSGMLDVRGSLGKVLTSLGRFDEAIPLLRANVDSTRQLLGDKHPALAGALAQLASALRQSGDAKAAIPVFREAVSLYELNYGDTHGNVAATLTGLGQALGAEGSHDQAIAALMRAEQIDVQALGPMHTFTLVAKIALADARLSAGDASGAETGFRQSLDAFSKIGDGKHIYAEAARLGLGKALASEHRCAEAEPSLVEAKARFDTEFGAEDRRTIESATVLIHCMAEQGRKKQAKELFEASEQALNKADHDVTRQRIRLQSVKAEVDG